MLLAPSTYMLSFYLLSFWPCGLPEIFLRQQPGLESEIKQRPYITLIIIIIIIVVVVVVIIVIQKLDTIYLWLYNQWRTQSVKNQANYRLQIKFKKKHQEINLQRHYNDFLIVP